MKDGCQSIGVWRMRNQSNVFRYPHGLVENLLAHSRRPASSVV